MNATESAAKQVPFLSGLWTETSSLTLVVSEWIWLAALYTIPFSLKHEVLPVFVSFAIPGLLSYAFSKTLHHFMIPKFWLRVILAVWVIAALSAWLWAFVFAQRQIDLGRLASGGFASIVNASELQRLLLQIVLFLLMLRSSLVAPTKAVDSWQVVQSMQLGLILFLIFGLTTAWGSFFTNLAPFALYLFTILVALISIRLAELSYGYGSKAPAFSRWWFISITLLALAFVSVSSLLGWLVGVVLVNQASLVLHFLYQCLILYVMIVLYPLLFILQATMPFLSEMISSLVQNSFVQQQLEFIRSILQIKIESRESAPIVLDNGLTVGMALTVVMIILAIIFGLRLRRLRRGNSSEEEIRDLAAVQAMLQNSQKKSLFSSTVNQAKRWLASARIRRIYALLMKSCAELNHPRPESFTPLEFQPNLDMLFPGLHAETNMITQTYLKVRYGEYPELLEEMQGVHDAWGKIKRSADAEIRMRKLRMTH